MSIIKTIIGNVKAEKYIKPKIIIYITANGRAGFIDRVS
jgi:hypothetical protein